MNETNFYKQPTLHDKKETGSSNHFMPQEIGGYKIEGLLDKGGVSLLYLGIHPETHEPLAIKVLSAKHVSNPIMVERFMKEAQIIELTNHPNIVKLYGHGKWEGGVYIAMEFIQGISLRQMILQEAMSLKRALEIVLQISHALTHLHAHGIIHRDLKPENILLTAQGGIKVIDFGISQIYTEKSEARMLGTPFYMSPEQRENPLNVSFSSDIYSLGIIAYELATGRLSYGVIHLSNVPRGLQKILAKALQPKIEDRYEDIVDFIQDISRYLSSPDFKKELRGSDYLGELNEELKAGQSFLIPDLPLWPRVEMALLSNYKMALSSVYYEFFTQKDHVLNIVMGEASKTGVTGLLQIAVLKGMVQALAFKMSEPKDFVASLNQALYQQETDTVFSFALLTLFPSIDKFSYISCGYSPLWYLPAEAEAPRRLTADNVSLGSALPAEILEVDSNWRIGDRLILHTFQAEGMQHIQAIEEDEKRFVEALKENLFLSPQRQAEAIFRKISQKEGKAFFEKPATVICIERTS